ncbi:MAG: hypothetical protein ABIN80_21570 [Dyadobacter sp.]|uniref:hypothetical protein n=1 Tax=Dyadobacter sp. TaxID=1914288 RepID=UPI0032632CA1
MNNPFNPLFDVPAASDFTATLAQEIPKPLASIDLFLELLIAEPIDEIPLPLYLNT